MHTTPAERRALDAASDPIAAHSRRRAARAAARRGRDTRGEVAIVRATCNGPAVSFLDGHYAPAGRDRLVAAMRLALSVYAERTGEQSLTWPRAVWVQERAGQWSPA